MSRIADGIGVLNETSFDGAEESENYRSALSPENKSLLDKLFRGAGPRANFFSSGQATNDPRTRSRPEERK